MGRKTGRNWSGRERFTPYGKRSEVPKGQSTIKATSFLTSPSTLAPVRSLTPELIGSPERGPMPKQSPTALKRTPACPHPDLMGLTLDWHLEDLGTEQILISLRKQSTKELAKQISGEITTGSVFVTTVPSLCTEQSVPRRELVLPTSLFSGALPQLESRPSSSMSRPARSGNLSQLDHPIGGTGTMALRTLSSMSTMAGSPGRSYFASWTDFQSNLKCEVDEFPVPRSGSSSPLTPTQSIGTDMDPEWLIKLLDEGSLPSSPDLISSPIGGWNLPEEKSTPL